MSTTITRRQLGTDRRVGHAAALFGVGFPLWFEPYVYAVASRLSGEYRGGYWQFYALSNGGFYMAPESDRRFPVACENGFEGELSADALGVTACLYAYSHLSFSGPDAFAEACARHYHRLRDYALGHPEAGAILAAID